MSPGAARGRPPAWLPCGQDQPLLSKSSRSQQGQRGKEKEPQALIYFFLSHVTPAWGGHSPTWQPLVWGRLHCTPITHNGGHQPPTVPHDCTGSSCTGSFMGDRDLHWLSAWPVRGQLYCGTDPSSLLPTIAPGRGCRGWSHALGRSLGGFLRRSMDTLRRRKKKRSGGEARQWQPEGPVGARCQGKQGSHLM